MSEVARADAKDLAACLRTLRADPSWRERSWRFLREPEIGLAMTRGRAGGDGAAFNLGEVSVTRCAVKLDEGPEGHAYLLGRAPQQAADAALVDAWMQTECRACVAAHVLVPLAQRRLAQAADAAAAAEKTKVAFFTMVRGDDT